MKFLGKAISYVFGLLVFVLAVSLVVGCFSSCTSGGAQKEGALTTYEERLDGMMGLGYSKKEAKAILRVMKKCGVGEIDEYLEPTGDGKPLQANRCMVHDHQVNFTTDNGKVFYIQITGCYKDAVDKFRGKNAMEFDLYDTDNVKGGYRAHYSYSKDSEGVKESVVDWDKWKAKK